MTLNLAPQIRGRCALGDRHELPRSFTEYLRRFYNDTAVQGNTANLMCAYAYFGPEHLVFATDFPLGGGPEGVALVRRSIDEMDIPEGEKLKILEGNTKRLLNLT